MSSQVALPQHTYYHIVAIIVAGMKMHTRKEEHLECTGTKTPSEESHPVTDPLGTTIE